jgi:hypothetical protein
MAKIRETEVERDADGRVTNVEERIERPRRGGFGWGALFGLVVASAAVVWFAYSQGSFQNAGVKADVAAAHAEQTVGQTAETAGDAAKHLGDRVENATDNNTAAN